MNVWKTAATSLALVVSLGATAACGSSSNKSDNSGSTGGSTMSTTTPASGSAAVDLVGSGCADYAKAVPDGAGSVAGMALDPVAVAASNNPLLKTLVAAVSGKLNKNVNLVDTLNGGQFTVFAPVDSAFAKLPASTVKSLTKPKNAALLTKILTYHVVAGQISPSDIDGTQKTVEGGSVTVKGSGDSIMVNDAHVICGGVHTANATVYLIDSVLMPM